MFNSDIFSLFGYAAATLTSISVLPQVVKIWKTSRTNDLSLYMFLLTFTGISFWLIYGMHKQDIAMIAGNSIMIVQLVYIIVKKVGNMIKFSERP